MKPCEGRWVWCCSACGGQQGDKAECHSGLHTLPAPRPAPPSLNPNHPVTQAMATEWHKIVALLMFAEGVDAQTISENDVKRWALEREGWSVAIKFKDGVGIQLFLVDPAEAARLVRKEGGRPA